MDNSEKIKKLLEFKQLINDYNNSTSLEKQEIVSKINKLLRIIEKFAKDAKTLRMCNISPAPAIGGMIAQNVNPFNMIFEQIHGYYMMPIVESIIEQTIGAYENNLVDEEFENNNNGHTENLILPEKITIAWLKNHVPINIWLMYFGSLLSAFLLGYYISKNIRIIE